MIHKLNLLHEHETNAYELDSLLRESNNLYEILRDSSECMRKIGFPTIGSPVLKLKNEILTLVYSVMQHQINCELYEELLKGDIAKTDLWPQLASLFEITKVLSVSYRDFLAKWEVIKDQEERKIIALSNVKLSVPA